MATMDAPVLAGRKLALVSILRAGNGLLDGILELIPSARVGFIGLYRDEDAATRSILFQGSLRTGRTLVIVVDPMLATGNSSAAAVDLLKQAGRAASGFCACWPHPRVWNGCTRRTRMCRSSPPRWTSA
jgi:uracil phosphoribosyltransferase